MIDYTWLVTNLWTLPEVAGKTDVVVYAAFTVTGSDGTYSAKVETTQEFSYPSDVFTPFEQLSESQVIAWIKSALGAEGQLAIENQIQSQIDSQKNPPAKPIIRALPWVDLTQQAIDSTSNP